MTINYWGQEEGMGAWSIYLGLNWSRFIGNQWKLLPWWGIAIAFKFSYSLQSISKPVQVCLNKWCCPSVLGPWQHHWTKLLLQVWIEHFHLQQLTETTLSQNISVLPVKQWAWQSSSCNCLNKWKKISPHNTTHVHSTLLIFMESKKNATRDSPCMGQVISYTVEKTKVHSQALTCRTACTFQCIRSG